MTKRDEILENKISYHLKYWGPPTIFLSLDEGRPFGKHTDKQLCELQIARGESTSVHWATGEDSSLFLHLGMTANRSHLEVGYNNFKIRIQIAGLGRIQQVL